MGEQRLKVIKRLIQQNGVRSQFELLALLREEGYVVTQATLSRDIAKLNVRKERDGNGQLCYTLSQPSFTNIGLSDSGDPVTITFSNHLAVLRTKTGYANGVAGDIDAHRLNEVIGTIAGDDTILLIPRQGVTDEELVDALRVLLPQLKVNP